MSDEWAVGGEQKAGGRQQEAGI